MLRALSALVCVLVLSNSAEAARSIRIQVDLNSGAVLELSVRGTPLTGGGAMRFGDKVRYPMTVTAVTENGDYLILDGVVFGTSASAPYRLFINRKTKNAYWVVNKGTPIPGKATVTERGDNEPPFPTPTPPSTTTGGSETTTPPGNGTGNGRIIKSPPPIVSDPATSGGGGETAGGGTGGGGRTR